MPFTSGSTGSGSGASTAQNRIFYFRSPSGSSGTFYAGGFYFAPAADANLTQAATTVNLGSANISYGGHVFMVLGAGSTNGTPGGLTITVTGTSIADDGTRTGSDSEVMAQLLDVSPANTYFQTDKRWIGQVTLTLSSALASTFSCDFNYGFAAFEDFDATSVSVTDFEIAGSP